LNGVPRNVTINLATGLAVSSVACNPASVTSNIVSASP
jgi:hypothetical protein